MGRVAHAARFHAERARCVRDSGKKRIVAGGWKSHASIPPEAKLKCKRARDIHASARWNRRKQSLRVAKIHATGNNSIHRSTTASSSNACFGEAALLLGHCLNVLSRRGMKSRVAKFTLLGIIGSTFIFYNGDSYVVVETMKSEEFFVSWKFTSNACFGEPVLLRHRVNVSSRWGKLSFVVRFERFAVSFATLQEIHATSLMLSRSAHFKSDGLLMEIKMWRYSATIYIVEVPNEPSISQRSFRRVF